MHTDKMDRMIAKKPWIRRNLKWSGLGAAVLCLLAYLFLAAGFGKILRVEASKLSIATVEEASFLEYLDTEGIVQPVSVVKLNAVEGGIVNEVLVEESAAVKAGDVILRLDNPNLRRQIEEESADLEKQRINYRERIIEMNNQIPDCANKYEQIIFLSFRRFSALFLP